MKLETGNSVRAHKNETQRERAKKNHAASEKSPIPHQSLRFSWKFNGCTRNQHHSIRIRMKNEQMRFRFFLLWFGLYFAEISQ